MSHVCSLALHINTVQTTTITAKVMLTRVKLELKPTRSMRIPTTDAVREIAARRHGNQLDGRPDGHENSTAVTRLKLSISSTIVVRQK